MWRPSQLAGRSWMRKRTPAVVVKRRGEEREKKAIRNEKIYATNIKRKARRRNGRNPLDQQLHASFAF